VDRSDLHFDKDVNESTGKTGPLKVFQSAHPCKRAKLHANPLRAPHSNDILDDVQQRPCWLRGQVGGCIERCAIEPGLLSQDGLIVEALRSRIEALPSSRTDRKNKALFSRDAEPNEERFIHRGPP
jgi:hypothetical protein